MDENFEVCASDAAEVIFEVASCERCDPLQKSGLLTRVPTADLVRPSRVALTCVACSTRYVRPKGE
jgi:hypothetical protein